MNWPGRLVQGLMRFLLSGRDAVMAFLRWLELVDQVRQDRHLLAQMSDRHLSDMGIDQATAQYESSRSAFDLPRWRIKQKLKSSSDGS